VETSTVSTSKTRQKTSKGYSTACTTSAASSKNNPCSFCGTEAETSVPRLPFAQKRSRTGCLSLYAALFTYPVKTILNTSLPGFGSR
jgi:hypothetical protein